MTEQKVITLYNLLLHSWQEFFGSWYILRLLLCTGGRSKDELKEHVKEMEAVLHKWMVTLSKLEKDSQSLKVANMLN